MCIRDRFSFKQTGVDQHGKVIGAFRASGVRPRFCERLKSFGVEVDEALFDPSKDLG